MALGGRGVKGADPPGLRLRLRGSLVFSVTDEKKREELRKKEVFPDTDGNLIISKKIMPAEEHQPDQRRDGDGGKAP